MAARYQTEITDVPGKAVAMIASDYWPFKASQLNRTLARAG
jgi:hypothetical protein